MTLPRISPDDAGMWPRAAGSPSRNARRLLVGLSPLLLISCGEQVGDLPTDYSGRDGLEREVQRVTLHPERRASLAAERANGNAFALHVGESFGVRATSVLRFALADSGGVAYLAPGDTLISASLTLTSLRRRPLSAAQEIWIWEVCSSWEEGELLTSDADPPTRIEELLCAAEALGRVELTGGDTLSATLALEPNLVERWMNDPETNLGLALLPGEDEVMTAISSENATAPAHIDLVVRNEGRHRIFSIAPEEDTYVVAITDPDHFDEAGLVVQNGLPRRALLAFDTTQIPTKATVLGAELVLYPDGEHTWQFKAGFGLEAHEAVAENWTGVFPNLEREEVFPGTTVDVFDFSELLLDSLSLNVQVPVQAWINDPANNEGLLFRTTAEVGDVSYVAFHAGPQAPLGRLPRLEVYYVEAAAGRFGGGGS